MKRSLVRVLSLVGALALPAGLIAQAAAPAPTPVTSTTMEKKTTTTKKKATKKRKRHHKKTTTTAPAVKPTPAPKM
jgi:hypothetical protein